MELNKINIFSKEAFILLLLIASLSYFSIASHSKINTHLSWDEVHYADLAQRGIIYNALEKNSLSFYPFVRQGLAKTKKDTILYHQLIDKYGYPDENINTFLLRHYHPPLATYFWSLFTTPDTFSNDKNLRMSNILLGVITILALFIILFFSKRLTKETFFWSSFFMIFLILSKVFSHSFTNLNFHTFQYIFSVLFVGILMKYINRTTKRNAIYLGTSVAFMFTTLETALFIISGTFIALLFTKNLKHFFRHFFVILLSFILTIIIIWPGVLWTLSPIKTWIMHAARIFVKGNDEYAQVNMSGAWIELITNNLLLFISIFTGILYSIIFGKKHKLASTHYIPFFIATTYFITITPFILNKTYIFPVLGLFIYAIVYSIHSIYLADKNKSIKLVIFHSRAKLCALILISSSLVFSLYSFNYKENRETNLSTRNEFDENLMELKKILQNKKNVIAFNGQLLRYYLKDDMIIDMRKNSAVSPGYFIRKNGLYINVVDEFKTKKIDIIIIPKDNLDYYPESKTKILENFGYKKTTLTHFIIFSSEVI